jgi:hypothetical protein
MACGLAKLVTACVVWREIAPVPVCFRQLVIDGLAGAGKYGRPEHAGALPSLRQPTAKQLSLRYRRQP